MFTKTLGLPPKDKPVVTPGKLYREYNPSLIPYWFKASPSMSEDFDSIIVWCEENCQGRFTIGTNNGLRNSIRTFWFKRQNDCTQFKLVWCHD
jgi:hypothetical protein